MAEQLLRHISSESREQREAAVGSSHPDPVKEPQQVESSVRPSQSDVSKRPNRRAKRAQVSAACESCRQKKLKVNHRHCKILASSLLSRTVQVRCASAMYAMYEKGLDLPISNSDRRDAGPGVQAQTGGGFPVSRHLYRALPHAAKQK